jgi:heat shock protein HslJ
MHRYLRPLIAAAGSGLALAVLSTSSAFAAGTPHLASPATEGKPATRPAAGPGVCSTIDFATAQVVPIASTGPAGSVRYRLTVRGTKPSSNVTVSLVPLVYVRQPEYWGIQVTGCASGPGLPVLMPYTATYDFTGPMGTCGIDVLGRTTSKRFNLAGCSTPLASTKWVLDPASLGVPVPDGKSITANFSTTTISGNSSCNTYFADYTTGADGTFKIGPIATTAMACEPVSMRAESTYTGLLGKATQFQVTTSELRLLSDGRTLLRFTPAKSAT